MIKKILPLSLLPLISFAGTTGVIKPVLLDGVYAGIGLGATALNFNTQLTGSARPQSENFGQDALLGDFYAGYNHDFNSRFNLGLEGLYSLYSLSSTVTAGYAPASSIYKNANNYGIKLLPGINLQNNARLFVEIGPNWGTFTYYPSLLATSFGSPSKYSKTLSGVITGLGAEIMLVPHLSVRGEYQYIHYASWNIATPLLDGRLVETTFNNSANQFIGSVVYRI